MIAYILPKNQTKVRKLRDEYNRYLTIKFDCLDKLNVKCKSNYRRFHSNEAAAAHNRMMQLENRINNLTEWLTP